MARHKKKETRSKDIVSEGKKPEGFLIVDSAIWWEANPDKSKKYGTKEFKRKKWLTPKEAETFLGVSGNWLAYFMRGDKGFPKLPYTWDQRNAATIKFARNDLVKYREMLRLKKFSTKARPPKR
jgi:hypothetical protein